MWMCPECSNEWTHQTTADANASADLSDQQILDANGNILADGDTVVLIKDLKVKGASKDLKTGTKVKNIRLQSMDDGHDISCKIDGFGAMNLKSSVVRKV